MHSMTYGDRIIEIYPSPLVTDAGQSGPTTMRLAMVSVAVLYCGRFLPYRINPSGLSF
jgi:hypothetical protein